MESIPHELLSSIFSHLSQEDLINLPFCVISRGLSDREIASRFSAIDVWHDERSLHTLIRASQHPLFADRIQSIIFHFDELNRLNFREFQYLHNNRNDTTVIAPKRVQSSRDTEQVESLTVCKTVVSESGEVIRKWRRYRTLFEAQENLKAQQKDYILLMEAMRRLRCRPSITFDYPVGFSSLSRFQLLLGDAWVPKCNHPGGRFSGSHFFDILVKSLKSCKLPLLEFGFSNNVPIRNLTGASGSQYLPKVSCFDDRGRKRLPCTFEHLRKFSIQTFCDPAEDKDRIWNDWDRYYDLDRKPSPTHMIPTLEFILSQCTLLEELEISCTPESRLESRIIDMPYLPLASLLNPYSPLQRPPLRSLTLSNVKITEPELVKFLLRYSETLRCLHLTNIFLTKGSRVTVFELLGGEMDLTSVVIDGIYQESDFSEHWPMENSTPFPFQLDGQIALEWLCGQSDTNPYENDTKLIVPRCRDIDRAPWRSTGHYAYWSDALARHFPSNIFTRIGVIMYEIRIRSWGNNRCWEGPCLVGGRCWNSSCRRYKYP